METTQNPTAHEQERDKSPPSRNHGGIQSVVAGALLHYQDQYMSFDELSLQLGNLRVTPDLCVYPKTETNFQGRSPFVPVKRSRPPFPPARSMTRRQT